MKRIDRIVEDLKSYFIERSVLEVACGDADFSVTVSKYAKSVLGVDVSLARVERRSLREIPDNVQFQEMDATQLDLKGESFDVVVSYNAMGHLVGVLKDCVSEMIRVLKRGGCLIFMATWKMDRILIPNIQSLRATKRTMQNSKEIENRTYRASIWKKT